MAFIISKKSTWGGETRLLYYLVENYREGNKIKRKTLLKLNKQNNLSEILQSTKQEEAKLLLELKTCKEKLDSITKNMNQPYSFYLIRHLPEAIREKTESLNECRRNREILVTTVVPKNTNYNSHRLALQKEI